MIFPLFTGLGPGGLKNAGRFRLDRVCIPGSSHGGIALAPSFRLYSDQAYDQQDTVSLLGGSGGEINYLITCMGQSQQLCGSDLSTNESWNENWLIRRNVTSRKTLGTLQ